LSLRISETTCNHVVVYGQDFPIPAGAVLYDATLKWFGHAALPLCAAQVGVATELLAIVAADAQQAVIGGQRRWTLANADFFGIWDRTVLADEFHAASA
jgi:hypothetical protein